VEACDGLREHLAGPFALFGHSFGALVAFEVARELRRRGGPEPAHLFISARRGPRRPDPVPPLHGLSDDRFLAEVRSRYGGIPDAVLEEPELLALLLPTLRADLQAVETYTSEPDTPLEVPMTAFGGLNDPWASLEDLEAWADETRGRFHITRFPGGHFYLNESEAALLEALETQLGPEVASTAPQPANA
jgi:medium-chain acyl-[acyl-carrier-protein] hydrolase